MFLTIHILDIAFVYFAPRLFLDVIELYQTTLFGIGEILLVFCVFYHGLNGLRIAYFDMFKPRSWSREIQTKSSRILLILAIALWLPAAAWMILQPVNSQFWLAGG